MDSIGNLIQLLRSQLALYNEILDLLSKEKRTIIEWKFTDTSSLVKEKEVLFRKESILDEARKTLIGIISTEYGLQDANLKAIMDVCQNPDQYRELSELRHALFAVAQNIKNENTSLKLLYSTNIRLVNDLHAKIGFSPIGKYGMEPKNSYVPAPSTFSAAG